MTTREGTPTTGTRRNLVLAFTWFAGLFLILLVFWIGCIRPYYAELALSELTSSAKMFHPHMLDWFDKPFSRYVSNYPDWNPNLFRAFIRPGENFYYFLCSLLFGDNYAAYHLLTYVCVGAISAFTFYIAAEILGLGTMLSCFLAALTFISPAYTYGNLFVNAYAADPLAGFWIMAAVLFFLARRYIVAWVFLCIAVGTKETAWAMAGCMALSLLFVMRGQIWRRLIAAFAYFLPLIAIICLRIHVFGLHGAVHSDETPRGQLVSGQSQVHQASGHIAAILKLVDRFAKWPFGVLAQSRQYDHRFLVAFRIVGSIVDIFFWGVLAFLLAWFIVRLVRSGNILSWAKKEPQEWLPGFPPAFLPLIILTFGSLVFPLRFASDPRYGTGVYPLIFLSAGCLLTFHSPRLLRLTAWSLLLSIGLYGVILRVSDATYAVQMYRAEWQFTGNYIAAIKASAGHPLFIVDDILGGENNSQAYQKFFGPDISVVRINDLEKDKDCRFLPDHGPVPIQLSVSAHRDGPQEISIRSVVTGCAGHSFLGVPQLPTGPLERSASGFHISYRLDPRETPQPVEGSPRLLEATIHGAPPDSVIIAPDFANRTYVTVPIQ